MKEITHICCSESAAMKQAIKEEMFEGKKAIYFFDDLSYGTISDISNIDQRIAWNKKIYPNEAAGFFEDTKVHYDTFFQSIDRLSNLKLIKSNQIAYKGSLGIMKDMEIKKCIYKWQ